MRTLSICAVLLALAACGAETATTAATGASIKKKELEEGKKTMEHTQQSIDQALEQSQQRARSSEAEK